jgi:hypothetical protein
VTLIVGHIKHTIRFLAIRLGLAIDSEGKFKDSDSELEVQTKHTKTFASNSIRTGRAGVFGTKQLFIDRTTTSPSPSN